MAARAIWKGVIETGSLRVPVKLYSAVQDHSVHFRLLHRTDHQPVKQKLIDSTSGDAVDYSEVKKAFPVSRDRLVVLDNEDLEKVEPEDSRSIDVSRFVDPEAIDHRWYERAYYLGPDGDQEAYFAAASALERKKKAGVARWTMRKKEYVGALRSENGYLMLIVLRHAEEVIASEALDAPAGRALQQREVAMARQLIDALTGPFDATQFHDEYRARVMELVETKARGGTVKVKKFRPKKTADESLAGALEASLAGVGKKKVS